MTPEEQRQCWADLAGKDAADAYRAAGKLAADGEYSVAYLKDRLRPAVDEDGATARAFLPDLNADDFPVRERATDRLKTLGYDARSFVLTALLDEPPPEARRRLTSILSSPELTKYSTETIRKVRAVQTLEQIGTPEAKTLLKILADGTPEARQTQQARAALERHAAR